MPNIPEPQFLYICASITSSPQYYLKISYLRDLKISLSVCHGLHYSHDSVSHGSANDSGTETSTGQLQVSQSKVADSLTSRLSSRVLWQLAAARWRPGPGRRRPAEVFNLSDSESQTPSRTRSLRLSVTGTAQVLVTG